MKVSKGQAQILSIAVRQWKELGKLDEITATDLENSIEVVSFDWFDWFDWKRLAKYSFWVSIMCVIASVGSVLFDRELVRKLLEFISGTPYIIRFLSLSALSAAIYWYGFHRRKTKPEKIFGNESVLFFGVLTTYGAVYQLALVLHQFGIEFGRGGDDFSVLFLVSFFIYAVLGYCSKSNLIWVFSLISIGNWMGTKTEYMESGWKTSYSMGYPLKFVLFGGALTGFALLSKKNLRLQYFSRSTLAIGLLYLFIALWILSIFGNHDDAAWWYGTRQVEVFHWSLLLAIVACVSIYHGLRFDKGMTKGFGITFLFINLYTRFFEYFWNATHKAVFFGLLGVSFWLLGSKAEKIWHLRKIQKAIKNKL